MARDIPGCAGKGCTCGHSSHNSHTLDVAEEFGGLADQLCRDGDFREASHMYERQLEQLSVVHGRDSAELVPVLLNAADACRSADRKGRSTELVSRALALLEKHFGLVSDDPATVLELYANRLQTERKLYLYAQMAARAKAFRCRRDS